MKSLFWILGLNFVALLQYSAFLGLLQTHGVAGEGTDEKGNSTCPMTEFMCGNGACIILSWKCDTHTDCPDGSDEVDCPDRTCSEEEFRCRTGDCIPMRWSCDEDDSDCPDGSDEDRKTCSSRTCGPNHFACDSGLCIPAAWRCDETSDCRVVDGEDERNCTTQETCKGNEFKCANDRCISDRWVCDNDNDCLDNSDEKGCGTRSPECDANQFQCDDGTCINEDWHCDGEFDCNNHTDEKNCDTNVTNCLEFQFECKTSKTCIHQSWFCDGDPDCPDESDEECEVTCKPGHFLCTEGKYCLADSLRCDGFEDCQDASDEHNCTTPSVCPKGEFSCGEDNPTKCIALKLVCDGTDDCGNEADEHQSLHCEDNPCESYNGGCDHICINKYRRQHECTCRPGYKLSKDSSTKCVDIDECENNEIRGTCSQKCFNKEGSYKCDCFENYSIKRKRYCKADGGNPLLLLANKKDLRTIHLETFQYKLLLENDKIHEAIAMDYHFKDKKYYWTDVKTEQILRADFKNVSSVDVIVDKDIHTPDGLAVDWINNNMYWTDTGMKKIEVASLDGSMRKVLVNTGLGEPRAIVVDPNSGYIYWTDWGKEPKIERCTMNGENRETIVSTEIRWPNGLTIDYEGKRLYWMDANLHRIESSNMYGTNRVTILTSHLHLKRPFAITVFEDYLYWTDGPTESVWKVSKFIHGKVERIALNLHSPMDIHVLHPYRQHTTDTGRKFCGDNKQGCSHFCFPNPLVDAKYSCDCPDGFTLKGDGHTCIEGADRTCSEEEFRCRTGDCIPMRWSCDEDDSDCPDGSDEDRKTCSSRTCGPNHFACDSGLCIPAAWRCDETSDCREVDGEDERNCTTQETCKGNEFKCANDRCISDRWVCDNDNDCLDNSDEKGCGTRSPECDANQFRCDDGTCINEDWHCDGEFDCYNHTDEKNCDTNVTNCLEFQFECKTSKTCIHQSWFCDGDPDCPDESDEECEVTCKPGHFLCTEGKYCLADSLRCDGFEDCQDASDEHNCTTPRVCPEGEFSCGEDNPTKCIALKLVCDGTDDCGNEADEHQSLHCEDNPCESYNGGCDHICINKYRGQRECTCRPGYKLSKDSSTKCEDIDECENNEIRGTCSQKCFNKEGSYKCDCFENYSIERKRYCKADGGNPLLLLANKKDLRTIHLETFQYKLLLENDKIHEAIAMDYHFKDKKYYWTDVKTEQILRADFKNVSSVDVIVDKDIHTPDGLAVDWINNNMYWTDTGMKKIEVASLDGSMRKVLVNTGLGEPRAIVVDPNSGYIYWTDWGKEPKIERCTMNGENRQTIVSTEIRWPNGLTIDYEGKRLYWMDANLHRIESSNMYGTNRVTILTSHLHLKRPFAITVFEDYLYWTDGPTESVWKVSKFMHGRVERIALNLHFPMDIHVLHPYRQHTTDAGRKFCGDNKQGCSHFCFPNPLVDAKYSCDCPDGFTLKGDGHTCIEGADRTCSEEEFRCRTGDCIPMRWSCDEDDSDCPDGSDEDRKTCSSRTCGPNHFACDSGLCIPAAWRCDETSDCREVDGEDERNCTTQETCKGNEFKCANDRCISDRWVCDNDNDCLDNSDEKGCGTHSPECDANQFRCDDGTCINEDWHCDGEFDCNNHTDEKNCDTNVTNCLEFQFECKTSKTCIHQSWFCDGDPDCPDESDEECEVTCKPGHFLCTEGKYCLADSLRCDGFEDCQDASDEHNCTTPRVCPEGEFSCGEDNPTKCIALKLVCDGTDDCGNEADEHQSLHCEDNPCESDNGGCDHICINKYRGQHECTCRPGYKLSKDSSTKCVDIDECENNEIRGTCSQKCFNKEGSYKCDCFENYSIEWKRYCKADGGNPLLLLATKKDLRTIHLKTFQYKLLLENDKIHEAIAMDYHFKDKKYYWTNVKTEQILRADFKNVSSVDVIVDKDIHTPDGLAVDWINNNMYWTDTGMKKIEVASLDGSMRKVLVNTGLGEPRAIVVDPNSGYIYWTDWGKEPKIERCTMNGENRETIVSTEIRWPNGLTIDYEGKRLYWMDANLHKIESSNMYGTNRVTILTSHLHLKRPFAITVFEDYLYWTDGPTESVWKMSKFIHGRVERIALNLHSPMDIHVLHPYRQHTTDTGRKFCGDNKQGCSHFCFPNPLVDAKYSCDCPDGFTLNGDGHTCIEGDASTSVTSEGSTPFVEISTEGQGGYTVVYPTNHIAVNTPQHKDEEHIGKIAGIVLAVLSVLIIIAAAERVILYKRYSRNHGKSMNFDKPVYRKTTTDELIIEKNGVNTNLPASRQPLTQSNEIV